MTTAKADTKERIIEAARVLFWEQGYTATGIAQILKHAEANSGSLYYFFPTKEDLLLAVLERYTEMLWPFVIQPVFDRVQDPIERIFGVMDGYRQMLLHSDCRSGCPIGRLALEINPEHQSAQELLWRNFDNWSKAIQQCVEEAAGQLPEGTDLQALARFVLVTMEGAVMLTRTSRDITVFDNAIQQLRDYFDRLVSDGTTWVAPRNRSAKEGDM